jgi:IS4 transposase
LIVSYHEASAGELIDGYRCRWEIEMFFDVLKLGCKVEKLPLAQQERIEKALVMVMIILGESCTLCIRSRLS